MKWNWEIIAKDMIEWYSDNYGTDDCCCWLASRYGFSEKELRNYGFNDEDINVAKNNGYLI